MSGSFNKWLRKFIDASLLLFVILFSIILFSVFLCSCSSNTISSEHDKTITVDTLYTMTAEDTEYTYPWGATLRTKAFSGPTQLAEESELIVLATAYRAPEVFLCSTTSLPATKTDYLVEYILRGEMQVGDVISACEDGGLLPYEIYFESVARNFYGDEVEFEESFKGTLTSGFSFTMGDFPKKGEQYILFLKDGSSEFVPGSYAVVGGFSGRYIKTDSDLFSRYEPSPGFYPITNERSKIYSPDIFYNEMLGERNPSLTFEEIQLLLEE